MKDKNANETIKSSDDTLQSAIKTQADLSRIKSADSVIKQKHVEQPVTNQSVKKYYFKNSSSKIVKENQHKHRDVKTFDEGSYHDSDNFTEKKIIKSTDDTLQSRLKSKTDITRVNSGSHVLKDKSKFPAVRARGEKYRIVQSTTEGKNIVKSTEETLTSTLKKQTDLTYVKSGDGVLKSGHKDSVVYTAHEKSQVVRAVTGSQEIERERRPVNTFSNFSRMSSIHRYRLKSGDVSSLRESPVSKSPLIKDKGFITSAASYGLKEAVSGGRPTEEDAEAGTTLATQGKRSFVRGVGAMYGAHKYRIKIENHTTNRYMRAKGKRSVSYTSDNTVWESGKRAQKKYLGNSIVKEAGDIGRNIRSSGDNYAEDGLVYIKNSVYRVKDTVKATKQAAKSVKSTFRVSKHGMKQTARVAEKLTQAVRSIATAAARAVSQAVTAAMAAVSSAPAVIGVFAIAIIIIVIMSIIPTFTLKSTDTSLTKIYKYCTNLDATFSEKVTNELSKDGYYRIDFYQNGAKSNGQSSWKTETDLDMLLAYYDAMFEDYSSGENEDEISEEDTEIFDNSQNNDSENTDESESYLKSNFKAVKKYSKNLWKDLYTLRVGTHTETITYTTSSGKTKERIVTILDVYVTTKTLMQMATLNAKDDDARDITYNNLLDIPFGYLTSSQQEVYDILQEVGTYTTLEEISNPFSLTSDTEQKSWSVSRRYGYYLHGGSKKENHGLLISAQSGAAVYAGVSGNISISGNYVIIKSDSREVTYGPLTSIQVRSGEEISSGTQIGSASGTSLEITFKRNGKELNPLFYISGYARSGSGVGNGDIVATALAEVGTVETGDNNIKYNTWYYGHEVNGPYPYCAVFISWCAEQNGFIDAGIVPRASYCGTFIDYYTAQGRFYRVDSGYVPVSGDFIMFSQPSYPNGTGHVGIVVSCDGTTVYTVEGNTSSGSGVDANGGGVWTKSYSLVQGTSTSGIWGFCNPAYPSFSTSDPPEGAELLGTFKITHYCPCAICNGSYVGQPTASGTELTEGRTIAVDSSVIPLGSQVFIEGYGLRTAEDTGSAIIGNKIDMYVSTHAKALELGVVYKKVYLVK